MRQRSNKTKQAGRFGGLITAFVFVAILAVLLLATHNLQTGAAGEGEAATRQAIERAAVLCFATEGFYPPGLNYLKTHYGVQIDEARYAVRYEIYAANVMPVIRVVAR